jgi:ATP diphosphatase
MPADDPAAALVALLALMSRLRDPQHGCPWDRAQDFKSIAPYAIEEAYEVREAIERGDPQTLCAELGDLLFQVVFQARLGEERGWFDFAAVADGIHQKLIRRHPHLFGGEAQAGSVLEQSQRWEDLKALERAADGSGDASALADIPLALPALTRAAKLGRRAGRVGFDWAHPAAVREKVLEELGELDAALGDAGGVADAHAREEFGDLLFALVNWGRHLRIDAEEALRGANAKFEQRFRRMEGQAQRHGTPLEHLSAPEWDALWSEAKHEP